MVGSRAQRMKRMTEWLILASLLALCLLPPPAHGAGQLDATFGYRGRTVLGLDVAPNFDDRGMAVVAQADGKLLVVGMVQVEDSSYAIGIARLDRNGKPDFSYGSFGRLVIRDTATFALAPGAAAIQPDGRLLITGARFSPSPPMRAPDGVKGGAGPAEWFVLRVKADGSGLDPDFGSAGRLILDLPWFSAYGQAMTVQGDGRIVLAGTVEGLMTFSRMAVLRLEADGSLDTAFNSGIGRFDEPFDPNYGNASANAVTLASEGRILVAGVARNNDGNLSRNMALLRLLSDGSPDVQFGAMGYPGRVVVDFSDGGNVSQDEAYVVAFRNEILFPGLRRILVGGKAHAGMVRQPALAVLDNNGALDTGFLGNGKMLISGAWFDASESGVRALALERLSAFSLAASDAILVGGTTTSVVSQVCFAARLGFSGAHEPGFNGGSTLLIDTTSSATDTCRAGLLRNGRFVLAGTVRQNMTMTGDDFNLFGVLAGNNLFRHGFE
jgi:uncharacterized delta-60 repeat protein